MIKCPIPGCNHQSKYVLVRHIRTDHNMTMTEFSKNYPQSDLVVGEVPKIPGSKVIGQAKRSETGQHLELATYDLNFLIFDVIQAVKKGEQVSMYMEDDDTFVVYSTPGKQS